MHQGRLVRPDGEAVWVLIRCRPDEQVDDDGFAALKTIGPLDGPNRPSFRPPLLHITRVDGVPAWVYEGFQGVSVARALDVASTQREFLPARAVMDIAERTVQGIQAGIQQGRDLQGPGSGVVHVGPAPSEVLVDAVGAIRLAGFRVVGEGEQPPSSPTGYAPARPGTAEQRAAYGVGAMLVHLLGGERPASAGVERARQDAVIRRSMIRVLARPGEAIPESVTTSFSGRCHSTRTSGLSWMSVRHALAGFRRAEECGSALVGAADHSSPPQHGRARLPGSRQNPDEATH